MIQGNKKYKMVLAVLLAVVMMMTPVCAATPRYLHTSSVDLTIGFDTSNVVYCDLTVTPYDSASGVSGLMKLYDSDGSLLKAWPVSDYEEPFAVEYTYQGKYRETYTLCFSGYVYGYGTGVVPDEIEISVTGKCK